MNGAHTQSLTVDLIITNDALYHLSYASIYRFYYSLSKPLCSNWSG